MKKVIPTILFCLAALAAMPSSAQNPIEIDKIDATNLGDGRILFRELETEVPLNGRHRIIDGYHSVYILADFTNGLYNGAYEYFENNALVEKGAYKEGVKNGLLTRYNSDGTTVKEEIPFTDGKVDGIVKYYYLDGSLEKEKGFKNGVEYGPERSWRHGADKPHIERNYFEGKPDGRQYAEISSNTGDYIEVAHFEKGVPTGEFLQTYVDSGEVKMRGSYSDGGKDGVWTEIRHDGKIVSEVTWADGKRNGPTKSFFTDNSVEKITMYADDKREGIETTFRYDGGRIASEYNYAGDKKAGEYRLYYDDEVPTLREEGRIERGTEVRRKEYYPDGKVKRIQERPSSGGTWKTLESYDENGRLQEP